jgi:hypothetical protein
MQVSIANRPINLAALPIRVYLKSGERSQIIQSTVKPIKINFAADPVNLTLLRKLSDRIAWETHRNVWLRVGRVMSNPQQMIRKLVSTA